MSLFKCITVTPEAFGADPTGQRDSAPAINEAAEACRSEGLTLLAHKGTSYRVDTPVNFRHVDLDFRGKITATFDDQPQVIIGGSSYDGQYNPNQHLWAVVGPTSTPIAPNVRVIGAKGQIIKICRANYLQLWADTDVDALNDSSIAYCKFELRHIDKIELQSNKTTKISFHQWINENVFSLQRCKEFIIDGTYTHNKNTINGGSFENPESLINIVKGSNNHFKDIRFENGGRVKFGEQTRDNDIEYTWTSINPTRPDSLLEEDLGIRNSVHSSKTAPVSTATLLYMTHLSLKPGYTRPGGVGEPVCALGNRVSARPFCQIYLSDMIPLTSNTRVSVKAEGNPIGGIRCKLIGYDSAGVEVNGSVDVDYEGIGDGGSSFVSTQSHRPSSNTVTGVTLIPSSAGLSKASFFRLSVISGGAGLECTSFSVWVDSDSSWGTNRQVGACAPAVQKTPEILLPLRARASLPEFLIESGCVHIVIKTWPGITVNSQITCSFGDETIVPAEINVKAGCTIDDTVVITVYNNSTVTVTLPEGSWVYMLAPGSTQTLTSI